MKEKNHSKRTLAMAAMILQIALLSGCGGGGGGGSDAPAEEKPVPAVTTAVSSPVTDISYTSDTYGLQFPTFLYASDNSLGLVLRAENVSSEQEMWFDTNVFRIDCPEGASSGSFDLAEPDSVCEVRIFNGFQTSRFETVGGTLQVDEVGERFTGSFEVLFADNYYPDGHLHWLSASFSAPVGFGEPPVSVSPPIPSAAETLFADSCQQCHILPELSRSGCLLPELVENDPQHGMIGLAPEDVYSLKVLLNATYSSEDPWLPH